MRASVFSHPEVRRWLGNLGHQNVHGSKDTDAENAMAKLVAYGLRAGDRELDGRMLPYAQRVRSHDRWWDNTSDAAAPFLIAAGYGDQRNVRRWFEDRLAALHRWAMRGVYDLYLPAREKGAVPRAWRNKRVYRPECVSAEARLPSCYDLVALAHWAPSSRRQRQEIDDVMSYVLDPRFQRTPGGYVWDVQKRRCYAAGRGWLACFTPQRRLLFLELIARFAKAQSESWFCTAMKELARRRLPMGTYRFPADDLRESSNSYYLYSGSHMGLGENRHRRQWREIESTFWMLNLRRLAAAAS